MIFPSLVSMVSSLLIDCRDFWDRDVRFSVFPSRVFSLRSPFSVPVDAMVG